MSFRRFLLLLLAVGWSVVQGAAQVKFVYNEDYLPLSFRDGGTMRGVLIELIDDLGRRAGFQPEHAGFPWERAQLMVKTGQADAFVTIASPARAEYALVLSTPLLKVDIIGVTSATNPRLSELRQISSIADAAPFRHVNYIGSGWIKIHLPQAAVTSLPTTAAIFEFLKSNRADLLIESELTIDYNALQLQVENQFEVLPVVFDTIEFRVQVSKKSRFSDQLTPWEKCLRDMVADGTVKRVLAKYGHRHS